MTTGLLIVQLLNGLQFGVLLFLVAAGLTLVFGVMDFINLAHGVQYMLGAYLAVTFVGLTGSFLFGLVLTKSESVRPIMVALAGMQGVYGASDGPSVIAATLVGSAPTLILFLVLQRYFVRGLTLGMGER